MRRMELLNSTEVAKRKGVLPRQVARWVAAKKLVPIKQMPGKTGTFVFDAADVDAFDPDA